MAFPARIMNRSGRRFGKFRNLSINHEDFGIVDAGTLTLRVQLTVANRGVIDL